MRAVAVLSIAALGGLGGWACVGTGLTEPTGFARFEFERIGLSGGTPDIRKVTIEQHTADD